MGINNSYFDLVPLEVHQNIWLRESKDFGDRPYISNLEVGGDDHKWIQNTRNFKKWRLHFLHSLSIHQLMDTLLGMVLRDKQFDNNNIFASQEDIKCLLRNIHLCLDDIDYHLNHMETYMVSESYSRGLTNPPT